MTKKYGCKLKSELAYIFKNAMNKKGISTYKELLEKCDIKINNHLSEIFTGKQKIREKDLLKLSIFLEIPMETFKRFMKKEVKYYVEEYVEMPNFNEIREREIREYNKLYKRKQRAKMKGM